MELKNYNIINLVLLLKYFLSSGIWKCEFCASEFHSDSQVVDVVAEERIVSQCNEINSMPLYLEEQHDACR